MGNDKLQGGLPGSGQPPETPACSPLLSSVPQQWWGRTGRVCDKSVAASSPDPIFLEHLPIEFKSSNTRRHSDAIHSHPNCLGGLAML